jgi:hypothetical protein
MTICKDVMLSIPEVIYTIKDFYLLDEFNYKIELMISAGLIDFWYFEFIDKKSSKIKFQKHPKSLKLQHFEGCFGILVCGSFVSFIVFVMEILMRKISVLFFERNFEFKLIYVKFMSTSLKPKQRQASLYHVSRTKT